MDTFSGVVIGFEVLLFGGLAVAVGVILVRIKRSSRNAGPSQQGRPAPHIVDTRSATGEIGREKYEQKKPDIDE
jgi:uncharacterized membrane protein